MSSRTTYVALTPDVSVSQFTQPIVQVEEAQQNNDSEEYVQNSQLGLLPRFVHLVKINTGLLLVVSAQAFLAMMNVAVKKLHNVDPPVSALQLVLVRMALTYMCCILYMFIKKVPDPWLGPEGVRLLLWVRGFCGFFGLFGIYYSLDYLSLSDATTLTFVTPVCTGIFGAIFLSEIFGRREVCIGLLSLVGVVFIARPTFIFGERGIDAAEHATPQQRLIAVGVSGIGVLGGAGAYTSIRAIGQRAHPLHSLSFFCIHCVIVSTAAMIITHTKFILPTRLDWLGLFALIGFFGFAAQVLLTMGLQRETAGRGAIGIYMQIIFASILERIFFQTRPTWSSVMGILIILGSACWGVLTKETDDTSTKEQTAEVEVEMEAGTMKPLPLSESSTKTSLKIANNVAEEEGLLENRDNELDDDED